MGCQPEATLEPVPQKPCVQRMDSISTDRFVFAFDSSWGNSIGGSGVRSWSGLRTYTRVAGDTGSGLFDVVDSGNVAFRGSLVPDSAPKTYLNKFQVRLPVLPFPSMAGLEQSLASGGHALSIAGCAEAWSDTIPEILGQRVSTFSLHGDSLELNARVTAYKSGSSTRYVFGVSEGLLVFERSYSGFMGSSDSFSLTRILVERERSFVALTRGQKGLNQD